MKIGIDISQIVYQTGVSRYTTELVRHLLKIDRINEYYFYAGSLRQRQAIRDFFSLIKTKNTYLKLNWLTPKLADLVWNRLNLWPPADMDIFHASNWALPSSQKKLITTIHDLTFLKYPQEHLPYYVAAHKRHFKKAKIQANKIIAVSKSTKKDLIDYGFASEKIKVIYEAAGDIFKRADPQAYIKKYNLRPDYFLCVGTLEPRKNLKRLIEAYLSLPTKTQLVISGKFGWGEDYSGHPGIKFVGFTPDKDLVGLYSGAKALVYPSLYEGFGLPVLEAMSCGCPVITSNVSSLPEVGGSAAFYVDPLKVNEIVVAMKRLEKFDDSNHRTLQKKSIQQAKKFSWEKTAKETLQVYEEAVK